MNLGQALQVIKDFFLEILGFLIPGVVFLLLIYLVLNVDEKGKLTKLFTPDSHALLIVLFGYVVGYVLHGFGLLKGKIIELLWRDSEKTTDGIRVKGRAVLKFLTVESLEVNIFKRIYESEHFKNVLQILVDNYGIDRKHSIEQVRPVRNLIMSFIPHADEKIYGFRFRADLCGKLSSVSLIISVWGIVSTLVPNTAVGMLKSGATYTLFYLTLLVFAVLFTLTRERFLSIAYRIAFPLFIASEKMTKS